MRVLKYILLIVCIYIYLYNPIFKIFGFGVIKLLLVVSFIYIIFSGFLPRFIKIFKNEIFLTLLLVCYSVPLILLGENTFAIPYTHLIWFLECFLIPAFLILFFNDIFNRISWEAIFVHAGLLASLITLFLIFNPVINLFIRNSVIIDTLDTVTSTDLMDFRGFSIAESSSYGYGIVQGLILSICLFSIRKNKAYIVPIIFLFISILFNARIGLVSVVISIFLLIISRRLKIINLLTLSVIIVLGIWIFSYSSFAVQNETSLKWAFSIFTNTENFIKGTDNTSAYHELFSNMLFLPENINDLLFGNGKKVFASNIRQSDVGYIIQIFRGGIVYLSIMFFFLWVMFIRNLNTSSDKLLPILFILTILIANIKGNAFFNSTSFFRLYAFFYVFSIFASKNAISNQISSSKEINNPLPFKDE